MIFASSGADFCGEFSCESLGVNDVISRRDVDSTVGRRTAYLAAQIWATADADLGERVKAERAENAKAVEAKDAALQAKLAQ